MGDHFRAVRMRGDSGFYDQEIVKVCEARGVEFFIVVKKHENVMKAVHGIPEGVWKPLYLAYLCRGPVRSAGITIELN